MQKRIRKAEEGTEIRELTVTALLTALTYLFTAFVNVRLPIAANGGLIHLGNVPLFLGAMLFGRRVGMTAGAVGMGLFDLLSGWAAWAPFTAVIAGTMGYVVGAMAEKHRGFAGRMAAVLAACLIKIAGYYAAEGILYGSWTAPLSSVPGNLLQIGAAALLVLPIAGKLESMIRKRI